MRLWSLVPYQVGRWPVCSKSITPLSGFVRCVWCPQRHPLEASLPVAQATHAQSKHLEVLSPDWTGNQGLHSVDTVLAGLARSLASGFYWAAIMSAGTGACQCLCMLFPLPTALPEQLPVAGCREQERIQKSEQARRETERILWEQQQEVDRKKAEMQRRDVEREKVRLPRAVLEYECDAC